MARLKLGRRAVGDPADVERWLEYARYVARCASIAPATATARELRTAAEANSDPTRSVPARIIRYALDAAERGESFAPRECA